MTVPSIPSLSQVAAREGDRASTDTMTAKIEVKDLNFFYGETQALADISITIPSHQVTAFIGPSGCGKSTFLRTLNRMNDIIPGTRLQGSVSMDGQNIYADGTDVVELRRRVGMGLSEIKSVP